MRRSAALAGVLLEVPKGRLALAVGGAGEGLVVEFRDPALVFCARTVAGERQPHQAAGALARDALPGDEEMAEERLRGRVPLLGGEVEPARRLAHVLLDAVAVEVEAREVVLGVRVAEVRRGVLVHLA